MQFTGAKGITLFVAIVIIACGIGFGSGLLVGRQFPAHRFERFGNSSYLFDPTNGKVCNPFKKLEGNEVDRELGSIGGNNQTQGNSFFERATSGASPAIPPCN
jgi:hypothetical protein